MTVERLECMFIVVGSKILRLRRTCRLEHKDLFLMLLRFKSWTLYLLRHLGEYGCWVHPKHPHYALMQFFLVVEETSVERLKYNVIFVENNMSRQMNKQPCHKNVFLVRRWFNNPP